MTDAQLSVPMGTNPIVVRNTLTEFEIIHLQDAFLCKGIHSIQAPNIITARAFIYTFLQSLGLKDTSGCLTMQPMPLEHPIVDICEQLKSIAYEGIINDDTIEQFFIEQENFDFIWIEMSAALKAQSWFGLFKQKIDNYLPVIIFDNL